MLLSQQDTGQIQRQLVVNDQVLGRYGELRDAANPSLPNGSGNFTTKADFSFGYRPIDGSYASASPGTYAVSAGDTLRSIARGAYGDQSLWYLIADANSQRPEIVSNSQGRYKSMIWFDAAADAADSIRSHLARNAREIKDLI